MSQHLLVESVLRRGVPDHAKASKTAIHQPETTVTAQETAVCLTAKLGANFAATARDLAAWDPVNLRRRNPTNDPIHADTLNWVNLPPLEQSACRKVGLVKDLTAALRRPETEGHVPLYPPTWARLQSLTTQPGTQGYISLPGLH
jgi:hypothetical protein